VLGAFPNEEAYGFTITKSLYEQGDYGFAV
jgi:hypothetical protein